MKTPATTAIDRLIDSLRAITGEQLPVDSMVLSQKVINKLQIEALSGQGISITSKHPSLEPEISYRGVILKSNEE